MSDAISYLVMWSNVGVEEVINLDNIDKYRAWSTLADQPVAGLGSIIGPLFARARQHPERCYEIYTVNINGLDDNEHTLKEMFNESYSYSTAIIRSHGTKVYGEIAPVRMEDEYDT